MTHSQRHPDQERNKAVRSEVPFSPVPDGHLGLYLTRTAVNIASGAQQSDETLSNEFRDVFWYYRIVMMCIETARKRQTSLRLVHFADPRAWMNVKVSYRLETWLSQSGISVDYVQLRGEDAPYHGEGEYPRCTFGDALTIAEYH